MMAKPKNLQIVCHKQGSQSHKEILETAIEDATTVTGIILFPGWNEGSPKCHPVMVKTSRNGQMISFQLLASGTL